MLPSNSDERLRELMQLLDDRALVKTVAAWVVANKELVNTTFPDTIQPGQVTPLLMAVLHCRSDVAALLVAHGASTAVTLRSGHTAQELAGLMRPVDIDTADAIAAYRQEWASALTAQR